MTATIRTLNLASMLLAVTAIAAGCSLERATLVSWQAPTSPPPAVRSIAVLPLAGPQQPAQAARESIHETLAKTGLYRLSPLDQADEAAREAIYHPNGAAIRVEAIQRGRRLGADAVLVGRTKFEDGQGRPFGSETIGFGVMQTVAVVDLQLLDVRTGLVIVRGHGSETHRGEFSENARSEMRVFTKLASEAGGQAAGCIVPRLEESHVELATEWFGGAAAELRRGNKLARRGQWNEAKSAWESAVAANPSSHALLYNLGLAEESLGNYPQAQAYFNRALQVQDEEIYRIAITRCEDSIQQSLQIARQTEEIQLARFGPQRGLAGHAERIIRLPPVSPDPPSTVDLARAVPWRGETRRVTHAAQY